MEVYGEPRLSVLGDPTRQAIFELLARRPRSVGELAQLLPVSRPAVSHHLRVLTEGGLAVSHANGTRRIYQLNLEGVSVLKSYLDRIWHEALLAFDRSAEGPVNRI